MFLKMSFQNCDDFKFEDDDSLTSTLLAQVKAYSTQVSKEKETNLVTTNIKPFKSFLSAYRFVSNEATVADNDTVSSTSSNCKTFDKPPTSESTIQELSEGDTPLITQNNTIAKGGNSDNEKDEFEESASFDIFFEDELLGIFPEEDAATQEGCSVKSGEQEEIVKKFNLKQFALGVKPSKVENIIVISETSASKAMKLLTDNDIHCTDQTVPDKDSKKHTSTEDDFDDILFDESSLECELQSGQNMNQKQNFVKSNKIDRSSPCHASLIGSEHAGKLREPFLLEEIKHKKSAKDSHLVLSFSSQEQPFVKDSPSSCFSKRQFAPSTCSTPMTDKLRGQVQPHSGPHTTSNVVTSYGGLNDSSFIRIGKRKFPGPAGLLPDIPPGYDLSDLKKLRGSNMSSECSYDKDMLCSQKTLEQFQEVSWQNMLKSLSDHMDLALLKRFNIRSMLLKASRKRLPKHVVIPILCVGIEKISFNASGIEATFIDETGKVPGRISNELVECYVADMTVGSVLVLKKATCLCNQLSVKPINLVAIYTSDGREVLLDRNFGINEMMFADKVGSVSTHSNNTKTTQKYENAMSIISANRSGTSEMTLTAEDSCDDMFEDESLDDLLKGITEC